MRFASVFALAGLAALLISQPTPREQVGPLPGGGFLLNSGWRLQPAGRQLALDTFPMSAALAPDGRFLLVLTGGYNIPAMMLLLCILCREFAMSGLRMAAAMKRMVVEADMGGKVKTFVQLNAIGWLMGARMLSQDFPELFAGQDRLWVTGVRALGMCLFGLSAILTISSGVVYFRRHWHVLAT